MKRLFLFLSVLLAASFSAAQAQSPGGWRLGFGIDGGLPTKNPFQYTLGGDIRLQKDFNNRLSGTLTAGFSHFFEKDHFDGYNQYGSPYNVIPLKAGIKYFLMDNFYLGAEAGAGFGFEQWGNSFIWSPSVGLAFKNGIDLSIKYEDYTKNKITKDVALRIAYGFGTRKLTVHKKANSIEGWELELSANPGLTTTAFDDFVLGGEAGLYKHLTSNIEVLLSAGYTHYFNRHENYFINYPTPGNGYSIGTNYSLQDVIPIKAGLRLYTGDRLYIGGEAGSGFAAHGNTSFVYTPLLGIMLASGLDIGVKYDNYSSYLVPDIMSIKLGYRFKL